MKALAEKEYRDALQRLKDRNEPISLNKVALEAGKKAGSLREKRYPEVCEEVKKAMKEQEQETQAASKSKKKDKGEVIAELDELLGTMRTRNVILSSRILSLENELFEVAKELEELKAANAGELAAKVTKIGDRL